LSRYYWLKLKRDFFKRHDIRIVEDMPNGKDYILFYLKLLVESVDHEGNLRYSDTIPYNENMLASVTNTNIDIVRAAMEVFKQLDLIEILDDATIYMTEINTMLGNETEWARKKREYRARVNEKKREAIEDNSRTKKDNVRQEKEIEKEIDNNIPNGILCRENSTTPAVKEIIDYLNTKTGKHFRWQTEQTKKNVNARLKEGYTVDDFKTLIDNKVAEWKDDPKMRNYLRPETLFRPGHFESYLNQVADKAESVRDWI